MRALLVVIGILASSTVARADVQHGSEQFPGKTELSAHLGYQAALGGTLGNPAGFKLSGEFAHALNDTVWLDFQLNQVVGFSGAGTCYDDFGRPFVCGSYYYGGWATELAVGIKLKFKTGIPLVIEVPLVGAIELLYDRGCGDSGVALPVLKPGFGVKYFITRNVGVGGVINVAFGPGFHGAGCRRDAYSDLYGAVDVGVGAEFIL